jgi:predicted DNA-binding transcriptional regulator AlpA
MKGDRVMKLIAPEDLESKKGIKFSPCHLHRLVKAGKFPQPIKIGSSQRGRNAFVEKEIDDWLAQKCAERNRAA